MIQTYSEKLRSPLWQECRLEVFNRDNFTCTLCGDADSELHVHHEEYSGDPWEAPIDKLKTLCKHCHKFVESGFQTVTKIRKRVLDNFIFIIAYDKNRKSLFIAYFRSEDDQIGSLECVSFIKESFDDAKDFFDKCLGEE